MPTTSRTLVTNCGSVNSFQVSTMYGLKPNTRQIRETADCNMPSTSAAERVDQRESPIGGAWPSVLATRASTCSSVTPSLWPRTRSVHQAIQPVRGEPGPPLAYRLSREAQIVRDPRLRQAPPPHASTIFDRSISA